MPERDQSEPRYTAELYYKGIRLLLTLPYETAPAIAGTLNQFLEAGFTSTKEVVVYEAPKASSPTVATPEKKEEAPKPGFCTIHGVEMRKFEKNGKSWYSHKQGDGWCNGKQK